MISRKQLEYILSIGYAKDRLAQCQNCAKFNPDTSFCNVCGCYMPAKVLIPIVSCPDNYW
jgi:rRNA maturation endonuclease Nob1